MVGAVDDQDQEDVINPESLRELQSKAPGEEPEGDQILGLEG